MLVDDERAVDWPSSQSDENANASKNTSRARNSGPPARRGDLHSNLAFSSKFRATTIIKQLPEYIDHPSHSACAMSSSLKIKIPARSDTMVLPLLSSCYSYSSELTRLSLVL